MFERLIVASDLSPASYAVVSCLAGLEDFGAQQCLLLQCLTLTDAASTAFSYDTGPLEAMLAEQQQILERQGFSVETRTVVGSPRQQIVSIAKEEGYSLVVIGSQGRSLVAERLLGGVAYGVINSATTPVLVVPVQGSSHDESICEPLSRCGFAEHVLFATDFSAMADQAFGYLQQLVAHGARRVTLAHVQDKIKLEKHLSARLEEFNEIDRARLDDLKQALLEHGDPRVDIDVSYGVPHREITRLVRERDVQLVLMGTQGRGFVGELMLGSVSHSVVRNSIAPVLLTRG